MAAECLWDCLGNRACGYCVDKLVYGVIQGARTFAPIPPAIHGCMLPTQEQKAQSQVGRWRVDGAGSKWATPPITRSSDFIVGPIIHLALGVRRPE